MHTNIADIQPVLADLGVTLEPRQPHMSGERHLTRPLGGASKFLLLGRDTAGRRVVIKASREPQGIREIAHERTCREVLHRIHFAYGTFLSPDEVLFTSHKGYTILITAFVEATPFLSRSLEEQFSLALKAFKAQESAHATTSSHVRLVQSTFGELRAEDYLRKFKIYADESRPHAALDHAYEFLSLNRDTIEQYCGFLTHWDFTPQNIRVAGTDIYLLDHSSLHFGNKYEGWARFINFMELYNPPLARALVEYVRNNRTPEESLSLKLMRVYRLGELIRYYTGWLEHTEGSLRALAQARITFWSVVLNAVLSDTEVPSDIIETYKQTRDSLRSEEEKQRQIGLH